MGLQKEVEAVEHQEVQSQAVVVEEEGILLEKVEVVEDLGSPHQEKVVEEEAGVEVLHLVVVGAQVWHPGSEAAGSLPPVL